MVLKYPAPPVRVIRPVTETTVGGDEQTDNLHIFTTPGDHILGFDPVPETVEVLVVGGGGAAGRIFWDFSTNIYGSGGGAGGVIYCPAYPISSNSIAITVGAGGVESSGGNSSFGQITAYGGGKGGDVRDRGEAGSFNLDINGSDGGSGGGAGVNEVSEEGLSGNATIGFVPDTITAEKYGNTGGNSRFDNGGFGGAGGGAGGKGENGMSDPEEGRGGLGFTSDITGTSTIYAQGGHNGKWTISPPPANYGSGGTGGYRTTGSRNPGDGQNGVVIVKWDIPGEGGF